MLGYLFSFSFTIFAHKNAAHGGALRIPVRALFSILVLISFSASALKIPACDKEQIEFLDSLITAGSLSEEFENKAVDFGRVITGCEFKMGFMSDGIDYVLIDTEDENSLIVLAINKFDGSMKYYGPFTKY